MGLLDLSGLGGGGGGFDPSSLLDFLSVGKANAQPSNMSVQTPGLNPDDLIASQANKPPLAPPLPTGSVPSMGTPYGPPGAPNMQLPAPPQITPAVGDTRTAPMFNDTSGLPPQQNLGRAGLDDTAPIPPPPALPLGSGDASIPPGGVGAALTGTPPIMAQGGDAATKTPNLAEALKGVKAPAAPVLQKISSPSPPHSATQIKSGGLEALLQALNAGGGHPGLPLTLGGGGRR